MVKVASGSDCIYWTLVRLGAMKDVDSPVKLADAMVSIGEHGSLQL